MIEDTKSLQCPPANGNIMIGPPHHRSSAAPGVLTVAFLLLDARLINAAPVSHLVARLALQLGCRALERLSKRQCAFGSGFLHVSYSITNFRLSQTLFSTSSNIRPTFLNASFVALTSHCWDLSKSPPACH